MNPDGDPQERPEGGAGRTPQAEAALEDAALHFSREQWAEVGDGEKGGYRDVKVKSNSDALSSPGLWAPRPAFLCHRRRRATELQEEDREDSRQQVKPWVAFRREQSKHQKLKFSAVLK